MNLKTFFNKFDQFADAPNAVKKMRELVMQLAAQGKLADQKRSDGNATQLLAAISSERDTGSLRSLRDRIGFAGHWVQGCRFAQTPG